MITYTNEKTKYDQFIIDCLQALFDGDQPTARIEINWHETMEENFAGLCSGDQENVEINLATNYHLEDGDILPYCDQELASNLAHELIHSRQFIRGEINSEDYYYKGKNYESFEYAETPWEIEAYQLEQVLVDLFWSNEWLM